MVGNSELFFFFGITVVNCKLRGFSYCLGIEIDDEALEICRRNIVESELEENVELLQLDITKNMDALRGTVFDTVIMNPPFGTKNNAGTCSFQSRFLTRRTGSAFCIIMHRRPRFAGELLVLLSEFVSNSLLVPFVISLLLGNLFAFFS